jgi:hypothetical protein
VIGPTFFVLVIVFLRYVFLVSHRQSLVLDMAKRSKHIVDSLFPSMVRDRLMQKADDRRPFNCSRQSDGEYGDGGEVDFAKLTKMNTKANQRMQESSHFSLPSPLTDSPTKANTLPQSLQTVTLGPVALVRSKLLTLLRNRKRFLLLSIQSVMLSFSPTSILTGVGNRLI